MKRITLIIFATMLLSSINMWSQVEEKTINDYIVDRFIDENGQEIVCIIVPGRPPEGPHPPAVNIPERAYLSKDRKSKGEKLLTTLVLSNVPAFDWCYGCSATAGAMMAGFYDNQNYPNMYTGPANSGVCPMDNSTWGSGESPLSATHNGYDGRSIRGNEDDYYVSYGSTVSDPYIGIWTEHTWGDCTGDYMGTKQSALGNTDGSTMFWFYTDGSPLDNYSAPSGYKDGCYGLRKFFESRNYAISSNYSQYIYGYNGNTLGFTYSDFQDQIDNGFPVLIQIVGHTMLAYGYNTTSNLIYIHDTWNHSDHTMTWGGSYSGMLHYGVSVFEFTCPIENEIPTTTVSIGSSENYSASSNVYAAFNTNTLTVQGDGSNGGSVTIKASESIHFYPGFQVNHGGTLSATIESDPCSTSGSPRQSVEEPFAEEKISIIQENKITIYPNPNSGVFTLRVPYDMADRFTYQIYNSFGSLILSESITQNNTIRLSMNNSPKGLYFIKVITEDRVLTEKFVIL